MPRNYKKETEREDLKYEKFFAKIDKELGKEFKENLNLLIYFFLVTYWWYMGITSIY